MEDLNFPICVLKMNLQCCEDLPYRVQKLLRKLQGVYAITIVPEKGLILVWCTVEPQVLIKTIEKTGQTPQLYGYEKDPEKAKHQFRSLLKRYKPEEEPPAKEAATTSNEQPCPVGGNTLRVFPFQGPMLMPRPSLPARYGPPACVMPGLKPRHALRVEQPKTVTKASSAPYPYNFYETSGFPKTDSLFRYFSDDHAQSACTIM